MKRLANKPAGKKQRGRTKAARVRRTLAIVLLVSGVLLETVANVIQLVESDTLNDAVAQLDGVPTRVQRFLQDVVK